MKIAFVGFGRKLGGIETFVINYSKEFIKRDVEIYFINVFKNIEKESYYKEFEKIGTIINLPDYRKKPLSYIKEFKKAHSNYNFDVLHYNMASAVYLIPLIAAKLSKIKTIVSHAHNDASDKGLIKLILHKINKIFVPLFSNLYFACSKNAAKWFFNKNILNSKKFYQINNAIELNKFCFNNEKREEIRKKFNFDDKIKVYGHIGSFRNIKNHEFLIDVFYEILKKEPNSRLLLLGKGELKKHIEEKVNLLNISDKVIFLGQVENTYDYLNSMDCFIMPSKHEGLGIVLIEAQANGLTCFASDGIPDEALINKNCYKISLNETSKSWAEKIINEKFYRNKANNLALYDINNCANTLYDIYYKNNKIKICHFLYGIKNGGVEKVITNYFSNIDRKKYDLHIVSQGNDDENNIKVFKELDFTIHNVTKKSTNFIKNFLEINKILRENNFDIVHCHMSNTNFFPLFYAKLAKVKYRINHSHNAIVKKNIIKKILCMLTKTVDTHRMACSKDAAIWLFDTDHNVNILKNAMDINKYSYNKFVRLYKRKELGYNDEDIVIGCVGRLENQKNQKFLLDVMKELSTENNNFKLIFIGVGENEKKLKEIVKSYNLDNVVKFLGSRNDVDELYQAMDIFALPSLFEGLGIVFVEAQISGLKCVSSKFVPYDAKICNNIVFEELTVEKWCNVIKGFNITNRKSYVEEAQKKGYDIKIESKKLDKYYCNLINKSF